MPLPLVLFDSMQLAVAVGDESPGDGNCVRERVVTPGIGDGIAVTLLVSVAVLLLVGDSVAIGTELQLESMQYVRPNP